MCCAQTGRSYGALFLVIHFILQTDRLYEATPTSKIWRGDLLNPYEIPSIIALKVALGRIAFAAFSGFG